MWIIYYISDIITIPCTPRRLLLFRNKYYMIILSEENNK